MEEKDCNHLSYAVINVDENDESWVQLKCTDCPKEWWQKLE